MFTNTNASYSVSTSKLQAYTLTISGWLTLVNKVTNYNSYSICSIHSLHISC